MSVYNVHASTHTVPDKEQKPIKMNARDEK